MVWTSHTVNVESDSALAASSVESDSALAASFVESDSALPASDVATATAYVSRTPRTIVGRFPLKSKTSDDVARDIVQEISRNYGSGTYLFNQTFYGSSFLILQIYYCLSL